MFMITTAFSLNMVKDIEHAEVELKSITWEEFDAVIEAVKIQHHKNFTALNGSGHLTTAKLVELPMDYRRTASVTSGDVLFVAQYRGPRLPEGSTELPEGATLVPIKVVIK